jgi:DNA/RNA-binding domain of Phe-tRNA-synthetase-like protein
MVTGFVERDLAAEFPELGLAYSVVDVVPGRSPEEVRERLRRASDRFTGPKAVAMRQQPIPWAYRVFFRHIGIDPDEQRTPIEAIALERMRAGGFASQGNLDDALLLATLETGVPVVAFDAAAVEGRLGEYRPLAGGQIVIADEQRPLAVLFGDGSDEASVRRSTRRVVLAAIRVKGVPPVSVDEALWTAVETLSGDGS